MFYRNFYLLLLYFYLIVVFLSYIQYTSNFIKICSTVQNVKHTDYANRNFFFVNFLRTSLKPGWKELKLLNMELIS